MLRTRSTSTILLLTSFLTAYATQGYSSPLITTDFIPGMDFRDGYDSTSDKLIGGSNCLVHRKAPTIASPSSLTSIFSLKEISTKSELADALGVSGTGSYDAGLTKVSASAAFAQSQEISSYSVGVLLKADAVGQSYSLYTDETIPELTDTFQKLYDTDYIKFKKSCGDYFLATFTLGGRYGAYFNFTTYSKAQKEHIQAKLAASSGPFEVSANFSKDMNSLSSQSTRTIDVYWTSVPGIPGKDIETLITDAQNFSQKVEEACKTAEGLKKCIQSAEFVSYENYFGPPESKSGKNSEDSIEASSEEMKYLATLGDMVGRLLGAKKVIESNETIYDAAVLATVEPTFAKAVKWEKAIKSVIEKCRANITACTSTTDQDDIHYGKLPDYDVLDTVLNNLPDIRAGLPASCSDHQQIYKQLKDGSYIVFIDQDVTKSYNLYCQDMAAGKTPKDYLRLSQQKSTKSEVNFLRADQDHGKKPTGHMTTTFTMLRIDPSTLIVDRNDFGYIKNDGQVKINGTPHMATGIPLGYASQCNPDSDVAEAIIDLTGTPFIFNRDESTDFKDSSDKTAANVPKGAISVNGKTYNFNSGMSICSAIWATQIRLKLEDPRSL